jgi:hypothetical protein
MREGRPVKGGAQQTRELLKRNTALNEELRRRGGPQEESDVERVLRQRGQAMPDVADAPPFFLKSSQALDAKIQGKAATPDQVKAILTNPQNGIKAEELKWTGVMQEVERLAKENNGKVPKDALLRYLAEDGAVRFEEVRMGGAKKQWTQADIDQLEREAQRTRDFSVHTSAPCGIRRPAASAAMPTIVLPATKVQRATAPTNSPAARTTARWCWRCQARRMHFSS